MTDPMLGDLGEIRRKVPGILEIPSDLACPYCLAYESSPHLAAEKESVTIEFDRIRDCYEQIVKNYAPDVVFLEGAGGICVPLSDRVLTAELIRFLGFDVLLVAPAGLGSINHTLLSLEYLRKCGIEVAGVILNQFSCPPTEIELDNIRMIESLGNTRVLAKASDCSSGIRNNPEEKDARHPDLSFDGTVKGHGSRPFDPDTDKIAGFESGRRRKNC